MPAGDAGSIAVSPPMKILKNFLEKNPSCCIVDIDSTIMFSAGFDKDIIDKLNSLECYKIVVTARSSFSKTYYDIDKSGLDYFYVYINEVRTSPVAFKKKCVREIGKNFDILFAVDDDQEILEAYRSMGLPCVSPEEFKNLSI